MKKKFPQTAHLPQQTLPRIQTPLLIYIPSLFEKGYCWKISHVFATFKLDSIS